MLVDFLFPDQSGTKRRPAVVLSADPYHRSRREVIVAAITSNVSRRLFGDRLIAQWREAGLRRPSMATGIIRTVTASVIHRHLGALQPNDLAGVDQSLRRSLGF